MYSAQIGLDCMLNGGTWHSTMPVLELRNENIDFFQMRTEPITLTFTVRCGSLHYDVSKTLIDHHGIDNVALNKFVISTNSTLNVDINIKKVISVHIFWINCYRSQNSDYKGSGFDRGHMAAAGNHRLAQSHVDQTFFLTNMSPQVCRIQ